jgi:glycosyltransferase involved in cell wall biosynthesis
MVVDALGDRLRELPADTMLFRPGRPGALEARMLWPAGTGPLVLCVCRLAREKGLDRVIRRARARPELRFLAVGTGPLADELRRAAPDTVRLTGLLEGDTALVSGQSDRAAA